MCSPMPDVDVDEVEEPPPCHFYSKCDDEGWCLWPKCQRPKGGD